MSRLGHDERGMALVTATVVVVVMMAIGLATVAFVSGQRTLSAAERTRELAFNLAEGVLNNEIFIVSQTWPGSPSTSYPSTCSSTKSIKNCPDPATMSAQFGGIEYASSSWNVMVQDNGGGKPDYYSTTVAATQPAYDANGDGKVWIRGQGIVKSVKRTLVGQVKAQLQTIPFPPNVITAGYFSTTSNGKKVIIDTSGKSYSSNPGQPSALTVRCNNPPKSSCLNYDVSKGQVSPPLYETSYPVTNLLTADQINSMRGIAKSNGTYTANGCPSTLAGSLVFIENGNCSYNNGTANSLASPGMVVIATGTLSLGGNFQYYGLVYAANLQNSNGYVISLGGCAKLVGGVAVDGPGGVQAGACGVNIAFNSNVFGLAKGYGSPSPTKGSWREVSG
jgi:hypothetical protein